MTKLNLYFLIYGILAVFTVLTDAYPHHLTINHLNRRHHVTQYHD